MASGVRPAAARTPTRAFRIKLVGIACGAAGGDGDTRLIEDGVHEWLDVSHGDGFWWR